MTTEKQAYCFLANLLSYPDGCYKQHMESFLQALKPHPEIVAKLSPFTDFVEGTDPSLVEEVFTRTFDMNPASCLEVGWHLYGEDYKRGEFLVQMRQALAQHDLTESMELPDHMSHCLQLLAKLTPEQAVVYAGDYLFPPIKKVLESLERDNPYRALIEVLQSLLVEWVGVNPAGQEIPHLCHLEGVEGNSTSCCGQVLK